MSLVASLNKLNNTVNFEINYNRLNFLLEKFDLSENEFLEKAEIKKEQLNNPVSLSTLKKIDKILNQGLSFYYEKEAIKDKKSSIFLRKQQQFTIPLNFESRKVIDTHEKIKDEIHYLANQIDFNLSRKIDTFNIEDEVKSVVEIVKTKFSEIEDILRNNNIIKSKILNQDNINTSNSENNKKFLNNLVLILDELNIFALEYDEAPRKKEKINFNGCYISPNIIVMKKEKLDYLRKQIFTLLHEFAHYLLEKEEIDNIEEKLSSNNNIELWCNKFAFEFLRNNNVISKNNIEEIYQSTFLSYSAIYTYLKYTNQISQKEYSSKLNEIKENIEIKDFKAKQKKISDAKTKMFNQGIEITDESLKEFIRKNNFVRTRKAISSQLFKDIVEVNFMNGFIKEFEFERLIKQK